LIQLSAQLFWSVSRMLYLSVPLVAVRRLWPSFQLIRSLVQVGPLHNFPVKATTPSHDTTFGSQVFPACRDTTVGDSSGRPSTIAVRRSRVDKVHFASNRICRGLEPSEPVSLRHPLLVYSRSIFLSPESTQLLSRTYPVREARLLGDQRL